MKRAIPGIPEYEVTDTGDVFTLKRGGPRTAWHRPLRLHYDKDGYPCVSLRLPNRTNPKRFHVHVLVAIAFIGPRPFPGAEIRHLDDVKLNNDVRNLAWGTRQDNGRDAARNGSMRGERNGNAKLSVIEVKQIRKAYRNKSISQDELARQFGIAQAHVSRIVLKENWREIA